MRLLLFLLLINALITLVYAVTRIKQGYQAVLFTAFYLFVPGLGFLLTAVPFLMQRMTRRKKAFDPTDLMLEEAEERYVARPQVEEEMNILPFSEVLKVSSPQEKRYLLLEMLKQDMEGNAGLAQAALSDSDSETSHYAAAAATEVYRKMRLHVQKLEKAFREDPDNRDLRRELAETIAGYLDSGVVPQRDRPSSISRYLDLMEAFAQDGSYTSGDVLRTGAYLSELGRQGEALDIYLQAKDYFTQEEIYLKILELQFQMRDREAFRDTLQELRSSGITLSSRGLEILRFWIQRG